MRLGTGQRTTLSAFFKPSSSTFYILYFKYTSQIFQTPSSDPADPVDIELAIQNLLTGRTGARLPAGALPLVEFPKDDLIAKQLPREVKTLDSPFDEKLTDYFL